MIISRYLTSLALAAAFTGLTWINGSHAEEYVSKAKAETLHQADLPGIEGKEVIIKHFSLPPGFVGGRHYHPGPVYVYVLNGEFTVETEDGAQTYKTGDIYPEPVNRPMQAKNLSTSDGLELLVFQVGDAGEPMMIKAE